MSYFTPDQLTQHVFPAALELLGGHNPRLTTLAGGASLRRYHRVDLTGGKHASLLVMELGEDPLRSEEATGAAPPPELPFLNVQRYLARARVAVPEIYRYDSTHGLIYLEDLGDITFESRVSNADDPTRDHYYRLAIDQLVAMQRFAVRDPDPGCVAFQRAFDFKLLNWELDHFREYGLEAQGHIPTAAERTELDRQFAGIAEQLASLPRGFVHRDYQSRNLMVQDSLTGPRLRVIDFQDALLGTSVYDLVGLLRDSYVALSSSLLEELVGYFAQTASLETGPTTRLFDLQTVQRKLKDAGRFVFIDRVKKNPAFLIHIPNSLSYVARALSRLPELASVREILARYMPEFR